MMPPIGRTTNPTAKVAKVAKNEERLLRVDQAMKEQIEEGFMATLEQVEVNANVVMKPEIVAGLVTSSHQKQILCAATLDKVSLIPAR